VKCRRPQAPARAISHHTLAAPAPAPLQLELLVLLMGERRSVTACGDDDQSIYSFLSAVPHIFAQFQQHFGARQLCLQTNFRWGGLVRGRGVVVGGRRVSVGRWLAACMSFSQSRCPLHL
jgi:hypothetical protein